MPKLDPQEQLRVWRQRYPAPCQAVCPVHTDVRGYVTLTGEGRFEEAYWSARDPNPLPAICGRACSAPCEDVCTRGEFDRPVRIRQLKRFLADRYEARPLENHRPSLTGRRVAIVGAGPAGLAAAHDLARHGHTVTIYESAAVPGGMATLGVPRFRLAMQAIRDDVIAIEELGVEIVHGVRVGEDVSLERLREENHALFIASGAMRPNALEVPGSGLRGVVQALTFLEEANLGGRPWCGRQVAVIGGGYTAMDAARTALRLGADGVTVLYRRTRRETEVHDEELNATLDEGVRIDYLVSPLAVLDDGAGRATAVHCIRNRLGERDASGRPRPVPIPGSEFRFPADMVILALGQAPAPDQLAPNDGVALREVDPETFMTSIPGVFAGGDFVNGPATIIEAVRDGRSAAEAIDHYLSNPASPSRSWPLRISERQPSNGVNHRSTSPSLDVEVEVSLSRESAMIEGLRCLYCGLLPTIVFEDCTVCHACAQVCPEECIRTVAIDEETGAVRPAASYLEAVSYQIDPDACSRCGRCFKACPTGAIIVKM